MRKVLIVEDDKFLAAIFALFIKDMGFELAGMCRSGLEAMEVCKKERPDVVLMTYIWRAKWMVFRPPKRFKESRRFP